MAERRPDVVDQILVYAYQHPDAEAIRQWTDALTYRELVLEAARIAESLRAKGIGPGAHVGVCAARTPRTVAGMLGIWLTGAAYVPLDPSHPRLRIAGIVDDAELEVVLVDERGHALVTAPTLLSLEVAGSGGEIAVRTAPVHPDASAHILYTSGSTGRPKGVLTTRANISAFVAGAPAWTGDEAGTRVGALSSFGFDATTVDLWAALAIGGCVQLVGEDDRADPARLQGFLAEHRVARAFVTPAMLGVLDPEAVPELRTVLVGGDVVPPHLVEPWTMHHRRFVHSYGPTEATVIQVTATLDGRWETPLPLGGAVGGHRLAVEEGELYVGGPGVANGYLGRPGLTAQRFVPDLDPEHPGARRYRTGDFVRLEGETLEFVGRRDGQVQIRGQRIEVGEVEAALRRHPKVDDVAVVASKAVVESETGSELELVAFTTPLEGPAEDDLRELAARHLTTAMVPRRFERLDRLPIGPNGKVDREALRAYAWTIAPDTSVDSAAADGLAGLWHRVLGGRAPDPDSDFFLAGGHSIAAMRLVAAIRRELGRDIGVGDVFGARTLAELSRRVDAAPPVHGPRLVSGHGPTLAPSQRRLWFLDQLVPDGTAYNVGFAERLRGPLDIDALRAALDRVLRRQDVLRWRIPHRDGVPYAVCDAPDPTELKIVDLGPGELPEALQSLASQRFELATGPLRDAVLFRLGPEDHVLGLAFHHAIVDGWSQAPLYADLSTAYQDRTLRELEFGYADYAAWRERRDREADHRDRAWWTGHLANVPPVLDLPRDRPRPDVQTYAGALISAVLPPDLDTGIRSLARDLGTPPATVVLAGLAQAVRRLTGATDFVLGGIAADRELAAMAGVVGFFVDIVPLRFRLRDDVSFADATRACLEEYVATTSHPGIALEQIVDALRLPRETGRSPLVQVAFNVYNFAEPRLDLPGLDTERVQVPVPGSPFDVTVYLVERDGRHVIDFVYNTDLYDADRVDRMAGDLVALLTELVADPERPVRAATTVFRSDGVRETTPRAPEVAVRGGAEPATRTERRIAEIWREVLGLERVPTATANFFDVGGNSLALVAVRSALETRLGSTLPVVELFRYPSVRALAGRLDAEAGSGSGSETRRGPDNSTRSPELDRAAQIAAARRDRSRRRRSR